MTCFVRNLSSLQHFRLSFFPPRILVSLKAFIIFSATGKGIIFREKLKLLENMKILVLQEISEATFLLPILFKEPRRGHDSGACSEHTEE